jgi:CubicO group peptidase (beta-lactamase class C family)
MASYRRFVRLFGAIVLLVSQAPPRATAELPTSAPEAQGVSSTDLLAFVEALDAAGDPAVADGIHSVMVVRHGHRIAEGWWAPYRSQSRHQLYSLSKSFTSTAVGIAVAEGKLRVDDPLLKFFPAEAPADPPANLEAMRVADLLRMATGHEREPPQGRNEPWVKQFLNSPVPFKPGTHFLYNTPATFMQSAIVQKATGEKLLDYLGPRFFSPLGIEGATWEESPEGMSVGGFGLSVRTGDIATFGQLLLQKGEWEGRQIVPEAWVAEATSRQVANGSNPDSDWDQGYGYQFWRCRHGAFRGDGAFGQYCIVLPEEDAAVAITSGTRDMQRVLDIVWKKLLPAFRPVPLPADGAAAATLAAKLASLHVPLPPAGAAPPARAGKTYRFDDNGAKLASVAVEAGPDGDTMVFVADGEQHRIPCGRGEWRSGNVAWAGMPARPAAVAGGWEGDSFTMRICFVETPFVMTARLRCSDDQVRVVTESNVGFGPVKQPELVGKAVSAK